MLKKNIRYTKPSITKLEVKYATHAAKIGWGEKCYDYIYRFQDLFKKHLGVKYAIATSSCTGALHLGLSALGVGPGDEVIIADSNWIASVSPVVSLGAKPIFVDILPDTWCIDPNLVETAITNKTKAIIAVHLYGNLCEMKRLIAIGKKYKIPIIEDSAEAIGSVYYGKKAGTLGKFATFSFHGTKTVTTGEGGMFVTSDKKLYQNVLTLSNHGRKKNQKKEFWADEIGFKFKLSNIQASIGCAQMERIDKLIKKKRQILKKYKTCLKNFDEVSMNPEIEGVINGAWMPTVVFSKKSGISREKIKKSFEKKNIDARVFFWPLSSLPMFDEIKKNKNSISISSRAINLPSYHDMTNEEIHRVCDVIKNEIFLSRK